MDTPQKIDINIADPVTLITQASLGILKAILDYSLAYRQTMTDAAKGQQDQIMAQMYWDWRALCERLAIVGPAGNFPGGAK